MPLRNFGSILTFAAEMEAADSAFYCAAAANPAAASNRAILEELARERMKNQKLMLRTCRESVCEMILEPIVDFTRGPFLFDRECPESIGWELLLSKALQVETNAHKFYAEAAEKIRTLREVSRVLAQAAKRRAADKVRLEKLLS
jgi:rubrerythrin